MKLTCLIEWALKNKIKFEMSKENTKELNAMQLTTNYYYIFCNKIKGSQTNMKWWLIQI